MQVMAGAEHGGAETAFEDMCLAMAERMKYDPTLEIHAAIKNGHPQRLKRLEDGGITVHALPFGGALDLYTPWKLGKIISAFKPDIVQTWMSRAAKKTPASKNKAYLKFSRLGGYYSIKYFASTDYFVTITPDIKRHLEDQGVPSDHVRHINNFAETEEVTHTISRQDMNTPEDACVVLALSRYHQAKALDTLILAVKDLDNVHLWLAGKGPMENDLKQLAKNLGIDHRVHFLGWRTDRAALLKAADICAFPSRYEPFGTTFVQAWAQRTPLICSKAQGPSQFVKDGEDGLMFEIDDVDGLTHAINRLIKEKGLGDNLSQVGYERYLREFSKEKTIDAYLNYYKDALKAEGMISPDAANVA